MSLQKKITEKATCEHSVSQERSFIKGAEWAFDTSENALRETLNEMVPPDIRENIINGYLTTLGR